MYCLDCGTQLPDGARFCYACGTPHKLTQNSPLPQKTHGNKNSATVTLLILVVAILVAGVAYLIVRMDNERKKEKPQETSQQQVASPVINQPVQAQPIATTSAPTPPPPPPPPPKPKREKLFDDSFTLTPGQIK